MHSHNESSHSQSNPNLIGRHLFLLVIAIIILAGLYLASQNMTVVGSTAILLLLAHVGAAAVIIYGGRTLLRSIIHKFHGQPAPQPEAHSHSHHYANDLETDGHTIGWAWFYDLFIRVIFSGKVSIMMKSTVKLANIQSGEKVLDVGCGTGTLAILAKQTTGQNAEIYGTDAAPEMINRAQQKAQQDNIEIDFQTGLVENIQFPDDTFDLVMNSLVMHHLPADLQQKALMEIYRVLKPGGRLLIVDFEPPKAGFYKSFLTLIIGDMTSIDNRVLLPSVKTAGFTNIDMGPTDTSIATYISGKKPLI